MLENSTHMVFLLDRSGSMNSCWKDTVGGLRALIEEQKSKPGAMTVSAYTFDDVIEKPVDFVNVKDIGDFLEGVGPRGMTSLYAAFCQAVDETGNKLAALPEAFRPEKVLFVVLTDGGENSSDKKKYSLELVKSKLAHQRDVYNWDFSFLGADFDVKKETQALGVAAVHNYSYDKMETRSALDNMSKSVTKYRSASLQSKKNLAEYMVE